MRLTDANDDHLGFLLMADKECPLDVDTFEGDCVFMSLPERVELFDEEPYLILAEHEDAGEHRYRATRADENFELEISGPLSREILITLGLDGRGEWSIRDGAAVRKMGFCHRAADNTAARAAEIPEQFLQFTPEQYLQSFECWYRKTADPQFSDGIPIIRAWMDLCSAESVSQADLDRLLSMFTENDGTHIWGLWKHIVHWGRELGLSASNRSPWASP